MNELTDCLEGGEAGVIVFEKLESCPLLKKCETAKRAKIDEPATYKNFCLSPKFDECDKYMESAD